MRSPDLFFSIIIPAYNSGQTIGTAIESVLEQSYGDFEVLIIDGLSTDSTLDVVQRISDNRLAWVSEKDNGIFDAMNKGILQSKGSWLLFLGSDDKLYDKDTLAIIADVIQRHPETRFVYGNVLTSGGYVQRYSQYDYSKLLQTCICHQAIYYHRDLFKNRLYDLKFRICSDWDLNLKVFRKRSHPIFIDRPLAIFNLEGVSQHWASHPEYLEHFADKGKLILRHRNILYLFYYGISMAKFRIKRWIIRSVNKFSIQGS